MVYLRALFCPEGFQFPIKMIPEKILIVEVFRELFSIVMLVSVAALIDAKFYIKFSFFAFIFGVWDIVYYIVLKISLNWPVSLNDWDILFLLPLPWLGPVWAPCVVSLSLILGSLYLIKQYEKGVEYSIRAKDWVLMAIFGLIVILSFLWEYRAAIGFEKPSAFPWYIFVVGEGAAVLYLIYILRTRKIANEKEKSSPGNR